MYVAARTGTDPVLRDEIIDFQGLGEADGPELSEHSPFEDTETGGMDWEMLAQELVGCVGSAITGDSEGTLECVFSTLVRVAGRSSSETRAVMEFAVDCPSFSAFFGFLGLAEGAGILGSALEGAGIHWSGIRGWVGRRLNEIREGEKAVLPCSLEEGGGELHVLHDGKQLRYCFTSRSGLDGSGRVGPLPDNAYALASFVREDGSSVPVGFVVTNPDRTGTPPPCPACTGGMPCLAPEPSGGGDAPPLDIRLAQPGLSPMKLPDVAYKAAGVPWYRNWKVWAGVAAVAAVAGGAWYVLR